MVNLWVSFGSFGNSFSFSRTYLLCKKNKCLNCFLHSVHISCLEIRRNHTYASSLKLNGAKYFMSGRTNTLNFSNQFGVVCAHHFQFCPMFNLYLCARLCNAGSTMKNLAHSIRTRKCFSHISSIRSQLKDFHPYL